MQIMSIETRDLIDTIHCQDKEENICNKKETTMEECWYSNSATDCLLPRRQLATADPYGLHSDPEYWGFQPLRRPNPPERTSFNSISRPISGGIVTGRSVSFSDPPVLGAGNNSAPNYRFASSSPTFGRERIYSLPSSLHHCTPREFDFPLVDDIFPSPQSSPPAGNDPLVTMTTSDSAHFSKVIGLNDMGTVGNKKKEQSSAPRGWLEVSIDSTMPPVTTAGLHKDSMCLSDLQATLPPSSPLLPPRRISPTPTTVGGGGTIAMSGVLGGSCLLKKLMPSQSDDTYSRKVFIGGLPPDIDQEEIRMSFQKYGAVTIDWPHKIYSKSRVPPKGYAFLLFKDEGSVHKLLACCISEGDKLFSFIKYYVSGTAITRKKCQIRPWKISESYYFANEDKKVDSRKAVFVGGVPRPLKAAELAEVMTDKFGPVSFVAIDCDAELKYPKGAACVVFATHASYIAAVSSRFMQLVFGSLEKKVEVKPYILEDQLCDECNGIQSDGEPAPFFCGSVTCLKYYCEHCWATYHSLSGRQNHRPMFKDIFDRDKFT